MLILSSIVSAHSQQLLHEEINEGGQLMPLKQNGPLKLSNDNELKVNI